MKATASNSQQTPRRHERPTARPRRLALESLSARQLLAADLVCPLWEADSDAANSQHSASMTAAVVGQLAGSGYRVRAANDSEQIVTPSPANQNVAAGNRFTFDANYSTDPVNANLTGLGIRLHFDSSSVTYNRLDNLLSPGLIAQPSVQNDSQNYDRDTTTDRYVLVAWSDPTGSWPGSLPARLIRAATDGLPLVKPGDFAS